VSSWRHDPYYYESYDPWIHCQASDTKSSHDATHIPQAIFAE